MIFILPFILGAAAIITGAMGIEAATEGMSKMEKAKKICEAAEERYKNKKAQVEWIQNQTNEKASQYGYLQMQIMRDTVGRFVYLAEQIKQKISVKDVEYLGPFQWPTEKELKSYRNSVNEAKQLLEGVATAAQVGSAVGGATFALASLVGTASTGTLIGTLSGAAARNAALAWLGGGSLAAGGGGMALGSLLLNGITIGPALMIYGWQLSEKGEEALTQATKYEADVNKAIATMDAYIDFLQNGIQRRIGELRELVVYLNFRCQQAQDKLEKKINSGFDPYRHAHIFQTAVILTKAVVELIRTPILDSNGNLNPENTRLLNLYSSKFGNY